MLLLHSAFEGHNSWVINMIMEKEGKKKGEKAYYIGVCVILLSSEIVFCKEEHICWKPRYQSSDVFASCCVSINSISPCMSQVDDGLELRPAATRPPRPSHA